MADKDFKVPSASLGRKSLEGAGHMPSVEDETVIKGAHSDTMVSDFIYHYIRSWII